MIDYYSQQTILWFDINIINILYLIFLSAPQFQVQKVVPQPELDSRMTNSHQLTMLELCRGFILLAFDITVQGLYFLQKGLDST